MPHNLRYLLMPFRASAVLLVVVFTIGLVLALKAGFLGIPLFLILSSWFFKYLFVLLDAIIAGATEPPVLSVEAVNPLTEQRPIVQVAVMFGAWSLTALIDRAAGPYVAVPIGAALLAMLPASVAVLGITDNAFRAAWPPAWISLVRGLGRDYVWIVVATIGFGALVYWLLSSAAEIPVWVMLVVVQWALLTVMSLIGGAVHENRQELGIDTRSQAERSAERDERDRLTERRRMLDEAYAQVRLHRYANAWQALDRWLAPYRGADNERAEYHAVLSSVLKWDDPAIPDRLTNEYLTLLLTQKQTGEALDVLERRLATKPDFQPSPPEQATRLAELASLAGRRTLRKQLGSVNRE